MGGGDLTLFKWLGSCIRAKPIVYRVIIANKDSGFWLSAEF